MQKNSFLSRQQIDKTIQLYVCGEQSLSQIIQGLTAKNNNLIYEKIIKSLSTKLRSFILDLQKGLGMAQRITHVKIYEHDSESIYEEILLHLKEIVPQQSKTQFMQLYKNSRLNGVQVILQTQYSFIHTDKQLQIYNSIVNFAQKFELFQKLRLQNKDPTQSNLPFQDIKKVFPQRDLQLIYRTFKKNSNNVLITYKNLKNLNLKDLHYKSQRQFVHRFDNVLLIGIYEIYKVACQTNNIQFDNWTKFKQNKFKNVNFQPYLVQIFRIGIRKDPTLQQIINIGKLLQKLIFHKNEVILEDNKKVKSIKNYTNKKQQNLTQKLYQQLNQLIQMSAPIKKIKN